MFDSERFFGAEGVGLETLDERALFLVGCFDDDDDELGLALDAGGDADIHSARRHPETNDYLGGIVDAVCAGVPDGRSEAARLLTQASCLHGPLSETEPALGYLSLQDVESLARELRTFSLSVRGLEADRVLLLKLLDVARDRGRGLAFMTG